MLDSSIYFEWDVHHWSKALPLWEEALEGKSYSTALELGSRNGGLSLWLGMNYPMNIICSDLHSSETSAAQLHNKHEMQGTISYAAIDLMKIKLEDNSVDVVVFKSVLGALSTYENQSIAMKEIFRVLKPGGVLLFAENLQSTLIHKTARKLFVKWAKHWRYLHINEMKDFMTRYSQFKIRTAGFSSILLPNAIKQLGLKVDDYLDDKNLFSGMKYIAYGYGIK